MSHHLLIDTSAGAGCLSGWHPLTLQTPIKNTTNHRTIKKSADPRRVRFAVSRLYYAKCRSQACLAEVWKWVKFVGGHFLCILPCGGHVRARRVPISSILFLLWDVFYVGVSLLPGCFTSGRANLFLRGGGGKRDVIIYKKTKRNENKEVGVVLDLSRTHCI